MLDYLRRTSFGWYSLTKTTHKEKKRGRALFLIPRLVQNEVSLRENQLRFQQRSLISHHDQSGINSPWFRIFLVAGMQIQISFWQTKLKQYCPSSTIKLKALLALGLFGQPESIPMNYAWFSFLKRDKKKKKIPEFPIVWAGCQNLIFISRRNSF